MKQLLDSRLEALAFNYLSLGSSLLLIIYGRGSLSSRRHSSFRYGDDERFAVRLQWRGDEKWEAQVDCYYEEDIDGETTDTEWSEGDGNCTEGSCGGDRWESWERVLRLRKGETGWYRYQDLTAINGNVVRLWDGSCRRARYS
ncbi:hypothetical protein F3Y22_tig00010526pilonHSYRG00014 [Hibiscus syriacus]|uniref:Uncharacterized protein n=1 Tax=Hibiscus syriacus TaxID=106335 RepID=A0A6A3C9H2_HIBSY|nr:hypothetical protein F3Y22_tig00010526pilonHSYRG00014 [Hibiscus syriacus]